MVNAKSDDGGILTEEEKQQLLKNVKMDFETVLSEQEELQDKISNI
jgi:hypothetical protein